MSPHDQTDEIIVIGDIASSYRFLNPLGRALLGPAVAKLADRLAELSRECGWDHVDHAAFAIWVAQQVEPGEQVVLLDKLLTQLDDVDHRLGSAHLLEAHRRHLVKGGLALALGKIPVDLLDGSGRQEITVVDDAAYTAGTLTAAVAALERVGLRVRRVLLGASTARADLRIRACGVEELEIFHRRRAIGDIIHARDVCPWLPFSGREPAPTSGQPPSGARIAPLLHQDGGWLADPRLARDWSILDIVTAGMVTVGRHLGRDPLPEDLRLLGPHVAVPVGSGIPRAGTGLGALIAAQRAASPP
jgi:hypothetical protein